MREDIDPTSIQDPELRTMVVSLMNVIEQQQAIIAEQAASIQQLRDEIRRLKGEQGQPRIKAKTASSDLSSEKQRQVSQAHRKSRKQAYLSIDREEVVPLDRQLLPSDAIFKGYEEVVVQDVLFRSETILLRKEKYYSPSQRQSYLAPLPAGYHGHVGPGVRAWVLTLYYEGGMSEPKILELLQTVGMRLSAGQLSDLLIKRQEVFHGECAAVVRAGLFSSPWQHLDSTSTRVNGSNQHCHVLCNPFYSFYCTLPSKDRLSMLRVLLGGADLHFQFTSSAAALMEQVGVNPIWVELLAYHLGDGQVFTQEQMDTWLSTRFPKMGPTMRRLVKDALAIAFYHAQTSWPVVSLLLGDDAGQFHALTAELALCWVHEFRHYKKLLPRFTHHCTLLHEFGTQFWQLYHDLLDYRTHPDLAQAAALQARFDQLFTTASGYQSLDSCKARTLGKRESLLMVLSHPELLLHNNPAELAARQRVRKRDVSLQARTTEGIAAWDTFQSLVATAKKLGVNLFSYFFDRITQASSLPSLAALIEQRAAEAALGSSWQQAP
jgi:hypothetical protein